MNREVELVSITADMEDALRVVMRDNIYAEEPEGDDLPDVDWPDDDAEDEDMDPDWVQKAMTAVPYDELVAETKASLGYVDTDPDPSPKPGARRLRRYWTRGPGAAKIKWGAPGDFKRCVRQLRKYVGPGAEGLCNVYHRSALGAPPGQGHGKSDWSEGFEVKRKFTTDERMELAESGIALPDGSYPIETVEDLKNAIQACGRASNKARAKRHIIKRAKALGRVDLLPEDWEG